MATRKKGLTERQKAEELCKAEIQASLDKYHCRLKATMIIDDGGTQTQIAVISKDFDPITGK